jgi:hypothetical protein
MPILDLDDGGDPDPPSFGFVRRPPRMPRALSP